MAEKEIKITFAGEKLEALSFFLAEQGGKTVEELLKSHLDKSYEKNVPAQVRKFVELTGDFISYDKNKLTFGYTDPDGAYTLNIVCKMSKDSEKKEFSQEQKVTIIGTVSNYKQSAEKSPNTLYINDCFTE